MSSEAHRQFAAIDAAFKGGDFDALGAALGGSPRWFDEAMPSELGLGHPLEYAIYWSPIRFIGQLISAGADPNYGGHLGFPSLIAALSTKREDRLKLVDLLITAGADLGQRGVNDWTPLHYAASLADAEAVRHLLAAGADGSLRTRIDHYETALELAERAGFSTCVEILAERGTAAQSRGRR